MFRIHRSPLTKIHLYVSYANSYRESDNLRCAGSSGKESHCSSLKVNHCNYYLWFLFYRASCFRLVCAPWRWLIINCVKEWRLIGRLCWGFWSSHRSNCPSSPASSGSRRKKEHFCPSAVDMVQKFNLNVRYATDFYESWKSVSFSSHTCYTQGDLSLLSIYFWYWWLNTFKA